MCMHTHARATHGKLMYNFQTKLLSLCQDEGARSALHSGGELEVWDANVVITAVEEDVGLRGKKGGG